MFLINGVLVKAGACHTPKLRRDGHGGGLKGTALSVAYLSLEMPPRLKEGESLKIALLQLISKAYHHTPYNIATSSCADRIVTSLIGGI